jgi:uncharacterized protein YigE (DUF2233 family)
MSNDAVDTTQEAQISQQESQQKEQGQAPDLNLNDLAALRSIVDVASQRGTFKAAELESVGKIYNKLNNFLEAVAKKEQ